MNVYARGAAWLLAPLLLALMIALHATSGPSYLMGDFRAFYCAGKALDAGANPYRAEPLRTCENEAAPPSGPDFLRAVALPAPLPPHALLLFLPLSRLPFPLAAAIYGAASIAAMIAAVVLFSRVLGLSSLTLNVAFAAVSATVTFYVGQPVPLVLLALAAAASCVRSARWSAAGACAIAATIEPHVALPALAGMLIALPRTRLPIVLFGAAAALAGVACAGLPVSLEYVRDVVPAHALANAYEWQFSLTSLLTSLGVAPHPAIRAGELMFALMTALGVLLALRLLHAHGEAAVMVVVPPAFAMFGGVHVHFQQLAVAIPAVLYGARLYPPARVLASCGIALAMIPWNVIAASPLIGAAPLLAGIFGALTVGRRAGLLLSLTAAGIVLSVLVLAATGLGPAEVHFTPRPIAPHALAETSWGEFSRAMLMRPSVMMQCLRLPTLAGLACGLAALALAACAPRAAVPAAGAVPKAVPACA